MTETRTTRGDILRIVESHPGCHLRGLERLLPFSLGALRHHLDRLEAAGLVRVEYDLRFKRYFPPAMSAELRVTCVALRQRQMRRIVLLLLETPGRTPKEIAPSLGLARSTLSQYLHRLRELGVIAKDPAAEGAWALRSPSVVEDALRLYRASFMDRMVDGALELFEDAAAADPRPPAALR